MKRWIAGFLTALAFLTPLVLAETTAQTSVQASAEANAKISPLDLKFRQIGEAFGDFIFQLRSALTFDEKAKIELLKERNAEMKTRQHTWIETKSRALASFESGGMTPEEKKEVKIAIQDEHETIIKEHLRMTGEINKIKLDAKAKGDEELESNAALASEGEERSELSIGLGISGKDFYIEESSEINAHESIETNETYEEGNESYYGNGEDDADARDRAEIYLDI